MLSSEHLCLVEAAVNGGLNEAGKTAFEDLYRNVTKPQGYTKPWFCGIENLTRDLEGFVCWKGIHVEHFDHDAWRQGDWRAKMKADAEKVATACQILESCNAEISIPAVVKTMEEISDRTSGSVLQ